MIYISKCPNCGGAMAYSGKEGSLQCEYCGTKEAITDWYSGIAEKEEREREPGDGRVCVSCGGLLEEEEHTAARICPYCGQTNVFEEKVKGSVPVRDVIPFRLTKQDCKNVMRKRMKRCIFAPKGFCSDTTLEKVKGAYLPYYLFDVDGRIQANFHATKVRIHIEEDEEVTVTRHYNVYRDLESHYEKVPLDGMKGLDDNSSRAIEPYQYNDLKSFAPAYLMGYEAGEADISADEARTFLRPDIERFLKEEARGTVSGYSSVQLRDSDVHMRFSDTIPAMLPAWILRYRFRKQDYTLLMNGQNGKMVGKFPVSPLRIFVFFGVSLLLMFLLVFAFLYLPREHTGQMLLQSLLYALGAGIVFAGALTAVCYRMFGISDRHNHHALQYKSGNPEMLAARDIFTHETVVRTRIKKPER